MTKFIMHGCNGAMGQVITRLAKDTPDVEIVAGINILCHTHASDLSDSI